MRIILSLIFFFSTIFANNLFAQDLFELSYQFPGDTTKTVYRGLCFIKPDGSGFLRLTAINKNTKKKVLYDFSLWLNKFDGMTRAEEGALILEDSATPTYRYCWSANFDLKEGTEIYDFDYLRIWFRTAEDKKSYEPCLQTRYHVEGRETNLLMDPGPTVNKLEAVLDTSGTLALQYEPTGILAFRQLNSTALTRSYLADFFTSNEILFDGVNTAKQVLAARNNIRPTLWLITVINTGDKDINPACMKDGIKITEQFREVTQRLTMPIIVKKVEGKDFTVGKVMSTIRGIYPKPDDVVVFYYSGHGFSYAKDDEYPFPQLALWYGDAATRSALRAASINMDEVFTAIKAKGARLNLVLSDCCNTELKTRRLPIYDTAKEESPVDYYALERRAGIALFFQAKGSIMVSAAKKGQPANASRAYNSFFTTCFANSLRLELKRNDGTLQWKDIIRKAQSQTAGLASNHLIQQDIIYKICNSKSGICEHNTAAKRVK